ncbi:MAG: oligosaccharide flippase family protein [Sterolibacterium sp.]|jgi:O-antigen/teichoic acid export membrane protein|nr:oligosaccharide flippase family protein [Sterolibacterium sp.]
MIGARARGEVIWVAAGQGVSLLLGMLTLKLLTFQLGPEAYGQFALGLSIAGGLGLLIYGPLAQAVTRYFHRCHENGHAAEFDGLVGRLLQMLAGSIVIVTLLLGWLAHGWMPEWVDRWGWLIFSALAYGLVSGTLSVYLAGINTRRERRAYALLQSLDALLRLVGAMLLVVWLSVRAEFALAGFLAGSLLSLLLAWHFHRQRVHAESPPFSWKVLGAPGSWASGFGGYAVSFALFAIPSFATGYGDRWVIQQNLSAADVGVYVALAQIANAPANLMLAIFSQVLNPILFQQADRSSDSTAISSSRHLLYRSLLALAAMLVLVVGFCFAFDDRIVGLLTRNDFVPYAYLLWQLVLAAAIFQLSQALSSEVFVYNRPFLLFFPKMTHAVLFVGLAMAWVTGWGLQAVVLASIIAATVYLGLVIWTNARARRESALI